MSNEHTPDTPAPSPAPATPAVQQKGLTLAQAIEAQRHEIARALPSHLSADRFARIVLTQVRRVPELAKAEHASFLGAVMQLAQVGLEPDGRNAHLVPFRNGKTGKTEVTPIIDYRGYIELARRSGQLRSVWAECVREHDEFRHTLGLHRDIVHVPATGDRGELVAVYAAAEFTNGGHQFVVLRKDEVLARAARSKTYGASHSPWKTDPEAMWRKTAIRALAPYLPFAPELARTVHAAEHSDILDDVIDLPGDEIDPTTGEIL